LRLRVPIPLRVTTSRHPLPSCICSIDLKNLTSITISHSDLPRFQTTESTDQVHRSEALALLQGSESMYAVRHALSIVSHSSVVLSTSTIYIFVDVGVLYRYESKTKSHLFSHQRQRVSRCPNVLRNLKYNFDDQIAAGFVQQCVFTSGSV